MNIPIRLLPLACVSMLLLACGGTAATPAAPAATTASTAPPPAAPPPAAAPTGGPTTTAAEAPTAATGEGIPSGQTAEGYWYLGRADAPVTLSMYSDFL